MKHKLILLLSVLLIAPTAAFADTKSDIAKVENWFNNLTTAKARFVQTANSGHQSQGTFYLSRPGKLRFEYDDSDDFIVADSLFIYYFDSEMGEQSNAPIGSTMADFILRKDFKLDGDLVVKKITHRKNTMQMVVSQADNPDAGSLMLSFENEPFQLKKWRVVDAQGFITEIELFYMETGLNLPKELFQYKDPNKERAPYNE